MSLRRQGLLLADTHRACHMLDEPPFDRHQPGMPRLVLLMLWAVVQGASARLLTSVKRFSVLLYRSPTVMLLEAVTLLKASSFGTNMVVTRSVSLKRSVRLAACGGGVEVRSECSEGQGNPQLRACFKSGVGLTVGLPLSKCGRTHCVLFMLISMGMEAEDTCEHA